MNTKVIQLRKPVKPVWLVTGLRSEDRRKLADLWKGELPEAGFLSSDDHIDPQFDKNCYHCIAADLFEEMNEMETASSYVVDVSPLLNLKALAFHLGKLQKDRKIRLHGIVHAFNDRRFQHDFNGKSGMLTDTFSVAEAVTTQLEFCDVLVAVSADDADLRHGAWETALQLQNRAVPLSLIEFRGFLEKNQNNTFFDIVQTELGAGWAQIWNGLNDDESRGHLLTVGRPLHPQRFLELVKSWPVEIIRSHGYVWVAGQRPKLYSFEQIGKETVAVCSCCAQCSASIEPSILGGQSRLAILCQDEGAVWEFRQELQAACLSDFEMKLSWSNFGDVDRLFEKAKLDGGAI